MFHEDQGSQFVYHREAQVRRPDAHTRNDADNVATKLIEGGVQSAIIASCLN